VKRVACPSYATPTVSRLLRSKILSRCWSCRVTVGVAYDGHATRFTQSEAPSAFAPRGQSVGIVRTGDFETDVDVKTGQQNLGVYLADTFEILPQGRGDFST